MSIISYFSLLYYLLLLLLSVHLFILILLILNLFSSSSLFYFSSIIGGRFLPHPGVWWNLLILVAKQLMKLFANFNSYFECLWAINCTSTVSVLILSCPNGKMSVTNLSPKWRNYQFVMWQSLRSFILKWKCLLQNIIECLHIHSCIISTFTGWSSENW